MSIQNKFHVKCKNNSVLKLETDFCQLEKKDEYVLELYRKTRLFKKELIGFVQIQIIKSDPALSILGIDNAVKIWKNYIKEQYRFNHLASKMMDLLCDYIKESSLPHTIIAYPGGTTIIEELYEFYSKINFKIVDENMEPVKAMYRKVE